MSRAVTREDELSVGDINLASAEVDGVDSVLHRADDVFRIVVPRQHVY